MNIYYSSLMAEDKVRAQLRICFHGGIICSELITFFFKPISKLWEIDIDWEIIIENSLSFKKFYRILR